MLISSKCKFIFVHNYKVAGSSVKKALDGYSDKPLTKIPLRSYKYFFNGNKHWIVPKPFNAHMKAREIAIHLPKNIFETYFKFGFVRNPWSWQVSLYRFMLKTPSHHQHTFIKSLGSFEDYINWRVENEVRLQKDFFYDEAGNLLVDYVGKFENLQEDFEEICSKIGIKKSLAHLNASSNNPFQFLEYYTQHTLDLVENAYKEDLDTFNYSKPILSSIN